MVEVVATIGASTLASIISSLAIRPEGAIESCSARGSSFTTGSAIVVAMSLSISSTGTFTLVSEASRGREVSVEVMVIACCGTRSVGGLGLGLYLMRLPNVSLKTNRGQIKDCHSDDRRTTPIVLEIVAVYYESLITIGFLF